MFSQKDSRRVCITSPAAEQREEREMPDFKKLCPGCMREIKENENSGSGENGKNTEKFARHGHNPAGFCCPHCGFSESEYKQNPLCLPLNTILAGKYLVGKVLGEGGFGITYMGYDLNMETRIAIKEYFPVELVSRDTTRRTMGEGGAVSGTSASGGGSDRVISLSGEKSKTYQQGLKKYVDEARNVSRFSGIPGIVSVKDFFYENDTAYIVMEYIEGVSLKEYLKQKGGKVSEEEALAVMRPVLEALEKVHAAGIVHRDISPDNIMLTFTEEAKAEDAGVGAGPAGANGPVSGWNAGQSGQAGRNAQTASRSHSSPVSMAPPLYGNIAAVRLIDFGAARMTAKNDQKSLTIILKHGYAPEEQYRSHGEQGPWTDVYALCAVFYRMLTGKVPEPAMDRLFSDGLKRPEELGSKVSPAVSEAIMRGLAVKKEDRIRSVRELMDALYAGKKLKKNRNGKLSRPVLTAALAACALIVVLAAAGVCFLPEKLSFSSKPESQGTILSDGDGQQSANMSCETAAEKKESHANGADTALVDGADQTTGDAETLKLEENGHELGEQIVWPKAETMVAAGSDHLISLRDDGTVLAAGDNRWGQCRVQDWQSVASVYASGTMSAGLRTDGTVLVAAANDTLQESVSSWRGITMLALGKNHILGLTQDGRVLSAGTNQDGCCETGDWENIVSVWAYDNFSAGIREDGSVVLAGRLGYSLLSQEEQEAMETEISSWAGMRQIRGYMRDVYGLKQDGTVVYAGREDAEIERQLSVWSGIVSLSVGDGFIAGLKTDGTVETVRYSVNDQNEETAEWKNVAALTGTMYNLVALCQDGTILVTEPSRSGNSTVEEILSLTDVVQAVWQGNNLAVLRQNGTVKSTGYTAYYDDETAKTDDWHGVAALASNDEYLGALLQDGTVIRTVFDGFSIPAEWEQEMGMEKASELAEERKAQTPELISGWTNVKMLSMATDHAAVLLEGGTAAAAGFPEDQDIIDYRTGLTQNGSCQVDGWSDLKQVLALNGETIGLKNDGTLLTTAEMPEEWKDYRDLKSIWGISSGSTAVAIRADGTVVYLYKGDDSYGQNNISGWTDMVQLSIGRRYIVGLRADGTVAAVGDNYAGQCDVEDWSGIVSIAAGESGTVGITQDGRVLLAGTLPGDYFVAEIWPAVTVPEE